MQLGEFIRAMAKIFESNSILCKYFLSRCIKKLLKFEGLGFISYANAISTGLIPLSVVITVAGGLEYTTSNRKGERER